MNPSKQKAVVVSVRGTGCVDIDIPAVAGYDGFDKLRQYLLNEYQAVPKSNADGPDARRCVLALVNAEVELVYEDPYGNSIHSIGPDASGLVERIGRDLELRLG